MVKNKEIFLNSSEHDFEITFAEDLMLRNYSRLNNFYFCKMIGGPESIRDLQDSKNIFADALEFPMIESLYAIKKIFIALKKVFIKDIYSLKNKFIFINISSINGLKFLEDLNKLNLPKFLTKENIIFNFNRRSITKSIGLVTSEEFEMENFEKEINLLILNKINYIKKKSFRFSVSGDITKKSFRFMREMHLSPDFVKTGLFTIKSNSENDQIFKEISYSQSLELRVMRQIKECLIYKYNNLNIRELNLINYLENK
tara:strand:- start:332 stop:1102 length:771 start_codon:yes stop_codon:yes gene_type:complete